MDFVVLVDMTLVGTIVADVVRITDVVVDVDCIGNNGKLGTHVQAYGQVILFDPGPVK